MGATAPHRLTSLLYRSYPGLSCFAKLHPLSLPMSAPAETAAQNVELFNRAIAQASAFHMGESIFAINDSTEIHAIKEETLDDALVLYSPECVIPVTAGKIRRARAGSATFDLPGGPFLGFFTTLRLN